MSATLYPALQVQTPDPAKPAAEWSQVANQQAQTALLGQQTQGAAIQNQLAGLNLGFRANALGMQPPGQPGASGATGIAAIPQPSGQPGQPLGPNSVMSPIGVPLPRMVYGMAVLSSDPVAAMKQATEMRQQRLSELLQQSTPDNWAQTVGTAYQEGWITPDQYQHVVAHPELRQQFLNSMATPEANMSLQGQGIRQGVTPDGQGGWQPSQPVISAAGQKAAATSGAEAQNKTVEVTVPDGNKDAQGNPTYRTQIMTQAQAAGLASGNGGRTTSAADYANPGITIGPDAYAGRIVSHESGGNQAAQNGQPGQTAAGGAQFTKDTWLQQVKQQRPDLVTGKTDAQILAMRTDASPAGVALMNQITVGYGQQNAAALAQSGIPVNAMTLGLAHQFGAAGVGRVLQSPPNTPIGSVVSPDAMKANPQFAGKTVGDVTAQAFKAYGINPVSFTQPQQPAAPGIAGAPVQTPQQKADLDVQTTQRKADIDVQAAAQTARNAAAFKPVTVTVPDGNGGQKEITTTADKLQSIMGPGAANAINQAAVGGKVVLTPQQAAALEVQTAQTKAINDANTQEIATTAKAYGEQAGEILKAGNNAPVALQRLDVIQNAATGFRPGASADMRLSAAKTLTDMIESVGGTAPSWLTSGAASGETIGKEGGYLAAQMTKALGSREAASVFQAVQGIQPNIKMSDGGFQVIINSLRQGALRDQDLKNYQEAWLADPTHNNSTRGMTSAFEQSHPVEAYASRVMPYPMPASKDQARPNVVYQTKSGPMIWNGRGFVVASAQ